MGAGFDVPILRRDDEAIVVRCVREVSRDPISCRVSTGYRQFAAFAEGRLDVDHDERPVISLRRNIRNVACFV